MGNRKLWSVKNELAVKSREAMLSAVQVYNNPNIQFKAETFIVLAIISWTYLLPSFYKSQGIDYCYYKQNANGRKRYDRTKYGAKKHWELERCLNDDAYPLDITVKENLRFLIGLRHEIEHQMTTKIDNALSARFQACCINYNNAVGLLLGAPFSISKYLSFSLQFTSLSDPQVEQLTDIVGLPSNIATYITTFDSAINDETYNDPKYSYRILFVPKTVNRKGQADKVIEFIPANSPEAEGINKEYIVIKEKERKKYLPKTIIKLLNDKGFSKLNQYQFTQCWKKTNAKRDNTYGVLVGGKEWYWYENYIPIVEKYCIDNNLI
jgi:hypothetical protein